MLVEITAKIREARAVHRRRTVTERLPVTVNALKLAPFVLKVFVPLKVVVPAPLKVTV